MLKRALLVFWALLSLACMKTGAQNIYLISAGVSDYPGTERDVRTPAPDAKIIHRLYKKNSKAKSVLLTNSRATKTRILASARKLFSKAQPDDIVVFFFSGHGFQGGFATYDDYLFYSDIREVFAASKAGNKMFFVNACHSGDMREGQHGGFNDPNNNIMLFLSSRPEEYSWEQSDMRNSWFTASLARALKGGADKNRDRIITARELFDAVSDMVVRLSDGAQHPVMWGNFKDSMPVMVW